VAVLRIHETKEVLGIGKLQWQVQYLFGLNFFSNARNLHIVPLSLSSSHFFESLRFWTVTMSPTTVTALYNDGFKCVIDRFKSVDDALKSIVKRCDRSVPGLLWISWSSGYPGAS